MGEIVALALKFGVAALGPISAEYGLFAAVFAFFAFMPLGHFTIRVLLVVVGLFLPKMPDPGAVHQFAVGSEKANLQVKGSTRTVLFAIGALIIVGSFVEGIAQRS